MRCDNRPQVVLLPTIRQKILWLQEKDAIMQQNSNTPNTGHDTLSKLNSADTEGGWSVMVVIQPAQSPDLKVNNLGSFSAVKNRIWKEGYRSMDKMVEGARVIFAEYDSEVLERVWQSIFKIYSQVLRIRSGNEFEVKHIVTAR